MDQFQRTEDEIGIFLETEKKFELTLCNFHKSKNVLNDTDFFVVVEAHGNLPATEWIIFFTWTDWGVKVFHSLINQDDHYKGPIYSKLRLQVGDQEYTSEFKDMTKEDTSSGCYVYDQRRGYNPPYADENGTVKYQCTLTLYSLVPGKRLRSPFEEQDDVIKPVLKKQRMDMLQLFLGAQDGTRESDVTIVTSDGKEIKALKAILAARCGVFKAMFATDMLEANTGVVNLPDLSFPAALTLVKYLYTGDVVQSFAQGNEEVQEMSNLTLEKREGTENYFVTGTDIDIVEIVNALKMYELEEFLTCVDSKLATSCDLTCAIFLFRLACKFSLEITKAAAEEILESRPDLLLEALLDQDTS